MPSEPGCTTQPCETHNDQERDSVGTIVTIGVVVGLAALLYYYIDSRATKDVKKTTMPASQIIRQAIQEIGTERRWTAAGHSQDYASFAYKRHASCLISILLSFLFLLPGIIYFLMWRKTQMLSINVFPEPDGTSSVQVSGSGGSATARGRRFLRGLPSMPALSTEAPAHPATSAASASLPAGAGAPSLLPAPAPPPAAPELASAPTARVIEAASGDVSPRAPETVFCQACGAKLNARQKFCSECGTEQPNEA